MPADPSRLRSRRGSVIVLVLAMVLLAAFFMSRFIERAATEMLVETRAYQSDRLRADAFSAMEVTLAVLADYQAADNGLRSPAQGWGEPLDEKDFQPREGVVIEVSFEDESGKLSLPQMEQPALEKLLFELGVKEADAKRVAEALMVWTRGTDGTTYETDARNYEYKDPPHRPPARNLESFDEIAAIAVAKDFFFTPEGEARPLLTDFMRAVSLYDFPSMNINAAQPTLLELAGLTEDQAKKVAEFNSGKGRRSGSDPEYFRDMTEAQSLMGIAALPGFDTLIRCLRVKVTARFGGTSYQLETVLTPSGGGGGAAAVAAQGNQQQQQPQQPAGTPGSGQQESNSGAEQTAATSLQYPFAVLALEEKIELQNTTPPPSS